MRFRTIPYFYFKAISRKGKVVVCLVLLCLINTSCIKQLNLYQGDKDDDNGNSKVKEKTVVCETDFFYPFDKEVTYAETTITIHTHTPLPQNI